MANAALAMLPALIHARLLLSLPGFRDGGYRAVPPSPATPKPTWLSGRAARATSPLGTPLTPREWGMLALDALAVTFCLGLMTTGLMARPSSTQTAHSQIMHIQT